MRDWRFFEDGSLSCSRFELVILASQRAYDLQSGSLPDVQYEEGDKSPVIALKELYSLNMDYEKLFHAAIRRIVHFSGSGYAGISSDSGRPRPHARDLVEHIDHDLVEGRDPEVFSDSEFSFAEDEGDE